MGAQPPIGFWGFVKAAFGLRSHVPLLGSLPLNKLALVGFGILGLGHPGFWLLGLAFEAAYVDLGDAEFKSSATVSDGVTSADDASTGVVNAMRRWSGGGGHRPVREQCSPPRVLRQPPGRRRRRDADDL